MKFEPKVASVHDYSVEYSKLSCTEVPGINIHIYNEHYI
jgi:hypothetical protein